MSNRDKIGLITAIIISMNAMIGAGIFSIPAKLALSIGPSGILTYIITIFSVLTIALSMAKVASLYPKGSFYIYTKSWGNKYIASIVSFSYIVGLTISLVLVAKLAAAYLYNMLPFISYNTIGIIIILLPTIILIFKPEIIRLSQFIFLSSTLFSLISTTLLGLININYNNFIPFLPDNYLSIFYQVPVAIFSFFGFESAISLSSIVEKPEKNVPKALIISILLVGTIYILFISSIIGAIPRYIFTSSAMPLPEAIAISLPEYKWLSKIIYISMFTALIGVFQSLFYSINNLIISLLNELKDDFNYNIIDILSKSKNLNILILSGIIMLNFFNINKIDIFFDLTSIFILIPFVSTMIALFKNEKIEKIYYIISSISIIITLITIFTSISLLYNSIKI